MTTITKPYPEATAPCAKHPNCQPRHSAPQTLTRHSTPNRSVPKDTMPNSQSAEFDRFRHNATQYNNTQRKLVRARARYRTHPRHSREGGNPSPPGGLDIPFGVAVPEPSLPINQTETSNVIRDSLGKNFCLDTHNMDVILFTCQILSPTAASRSVGLRERWMMDPATLSNAEWTGLANMLTNLWFMLLLIVIIGSLYLVTHVCIPSLVASHHLPRGFERMRLPLYVVLFVCIGLYGYFFGAAIAESTVIGDIFDTYWIKGGSVDLLDQGWTPPPPHR